MLLTGIMCPGMEGVGLTLQTGRGWGSHWMAIIILCALFLRELVLAGCGGSKQGTCGGYSSRMLSVNFQ